MKDRSKSGVVLNKNFRDSLIIDKYNPIFHHWRDLKLQHLRSENSEDVMTWNVFRSLKQINPELWLPSLFKESFQSEFIYSIDSINVSLWKKASPPSYLSVKEGQTEVDIIIESNQFVWFIEAKYKSDISMSTKNDSTRNQVVRNIDVGLDYSKGKDFYFSLLILDEEQSPKGTSITNEYRESIDPIQAVLPNRIDYSNNLISIGLVRWFDILDIFRKIIKLAENDFERFIAKQAEIWLENKIGNYLELKEGALFDETKTYRYSLTRVWNAKKEKVVFICLNPSTADEKTDDPTLKRCIDYAKRWHNGKYGYLEMVNLFSYRATKFDVLKEINNPIGEGNDEYILKAVKNASLVVVAWGENGDYQNRNLEVLKLLTDANISFQCLEVLKCGQPKHPLYAKKELSPILYKRHYVNFNV